MDIWVQNGFKCISGLLWWWCGWLGAVAPAAAPHHKRLSYCILLTQTKINIQNLKYGFYRPCFAFIVSVIQSESPKSSHCKSGTICTHSMFWSKMSTIEIVLYFLKPNFCLGECQNLCIWHWQHILQGSVTVVLKPLLFYLYQEHDYKNKITQTNKTFWRFPEGQ